jgi:hypothetical protein
MAPATASRAGVTPEASRDRSSGTLAENMKRFLILAYILSSTAFFAMAASMQTIASLPDGRPISSPPSDISKAITVCGSFKDQIEIRRTVVDNWVTVTYRVIYTTDSRPDFPFTEMSFTVEDTIPTKASGMVAKKPAWPFKKGSMVFYVLKDQDYGSPKFFRILFYKKQK